MGAEPWAQFLVGLGWRALAATRRALRNSPVLNLPQLPGALRSSPEPSGAFQGSDDDRAAAKAASSLNQPQAASCASPGG
eukprot:11399317-Alexandrium_andersonii.AAC.1